MAIDLRQSTASQEVPLGHFVDDTDGKTAETALSIANTDIKIWKTGATTLANKNSGGATHISGGIYYCTLDATDTDTIGPLVIFVAVSGALAVRLECNVLDEAVYDVKYGTTALATATNITAGTVTTATNVTTVNGLAAGVITAASIAADAITAAKIADNAIDAGSIAADAITAAKIADGAIDAATFAAGAINAAAIAADAITAAKVADGTIDAATFAAGAINAAAIAADAITDAKVAADVTIASVTGSVGSVAGNVAGNVVGNVNGNVIGSVGSVAGNVTGSVGSVATGGISASSFAAGAIDAAAIATDAIDADAIKADAVTEIQSGLATSASISALNNLSAAQVNAEVVDCLNVDTYAEPAGAPAATSTLRAKIGWIFKLMRNRRKQNSTTESLYADDGTTVDATSAKSDDGTDAIRGEWSA